MARGIGITDNKIAFSKKGKRRKGVHAKTRNGIHKNSKNYVKKYRGQGR